jgi:Fibronectin type III domain
MRRIIGVLVGLFVLGATFVALPGASAAPAAIVLTAMTLDGGQPLQTAVVDNWGGDVLDIYGTASDTSSPNVAIGSSTCLVPPTVSGTASAFDVTCVLPILPPGTIANVTVTLGGQSATLEHAVATPVEPSVTAISGCEDNGSGDTTNCPDDGGVTVQVSGTGLTQDSVVLVGGKVCANLRFTSSTQRSCVLPPGTGTQPVTLVSATGPVETGLTLSYAAAASPPPAAPTGVTAVPADGQATVSWSTAADPDATAFRVTPSTPAGPQPAVTFAVPAAGAPATMSAVVAGLADGTPVTFTVAAENGSNVGDESQSTPAVVPAGVPSAPTGVSARLALDGVHLSWSAPATDGGSPVTGYTITPFVDGVALPAVHATTTTATLKLRTGVYVLEVAASNATGSGPFSSPTGPTLAITLFR